MDGVLIIDKPENFTSHDTVARCRRILKTKRVGHTGTLDPFATGVLVVLIGKATRLAQFLDKDVKEYEAVIQFGFETNTGDRTGELRIANYESREVSLEEIERVLPEFRGEIEQTPPMYSAKKVAGKKLYKLARQGVEIERKPSKVKIYELRITNHELLKTERKITVCVSCSAGTYIRTLAEDIGKKIGAGAHLAELRRTHAGKFDLSKAVTLENLEKAASENKLDEIIISMNEAVSHLPRISLNQDEKAKVRNGMKITRDNFEAAENQAVRMIDERENLIAVGFYNESENFIRPKIVLV